MTDYVATLMHLVPNASLSYTGTEVTFESIEWLDDRTQPSQAECDAVWPEVEYELAYKATEYARQHRYLTETDGLFFDSMRNGGELTDWIAAVEKIKSELPYPTPLK
jgi:hypothetical protein